MHVAPVHRRARFGGDLQQVFGRACEELSSPMSSSSCYPLVLAGHQLGNSCEPAFGAEAGSHRIASHRQNTTQKQCKTPHAQRAEPWAPQQHTPGLTPSLSPDEPPRRAPVGTRMNGMGFGWATSRRVRDALLHDIQTITCSDLSQFPKRNSTWRRPGLTRPAHALQQAIPRERSLSAPPHAARRCLLLHISLPAKQVSRWSAPRQFG